MTAPATATEIPSQMTRARSLLRDAITWYRGESCDDLPVRRGTRTRTTQPCSHGEILVDDALVGLQIRRRAGEAYLPLFEDIDAVGERHHELQGLLGQHDRQPGRLEFGHTLAQQFDDPRRQSLRPLV